MSSSSDNDGVCAFEDASSVARSKEGEGMVLKRQIGLGGCIAFVVGTVIGSGIFISPKGVLQNTGSVGLSLVVWVACGILSTIGALCYAELGTTIPESGGDFTYILQTFGVVLAFLRVWTHIVAVFTASFAVLAVTGATYLTEPFFGECTVPTVVIQLLAATLLGAVFCLNSVSVPWSNRVQIIFSIAKVTGLLIIIVSGLVLVIQGKFENLRSGFTPAIDVTPDKLPLAFYSGLFAYSGWQFLPTFTEEIENPSRNIPLGITLSMTLITGVYILVNLAYYVELTPIEILSSDAVALTYGERVLGPWAFIISIAVALSCIGSINGSIFSFARILLVASRVNCMPQILGMIHVHNKTPLPAAIVTFPIVIVMLISPDVNALINYMSFARWLLVSIAVAVLPYWRWKYPDMERPFKVPIILPFIFILCALFVVAVSIYSSPIDCGIGALITLSGVPVYFVFARWQGKPAWFTRTFDSMTCFLQRFLIVTPEDKKIE
ncbi:cystine/glutamate transporter-like [Asterias rubens]|uniref:cystine/glutamate transporter-like n=1 Tax=Asterias rubens TaxID=7604 RepID=UPI0014552530|nr:cystine/glutamate transporter-like [Asterias rubens]